MVAMSIVRCPHCTLPMTDTEAVAGTCVACGGSLAPPQPAGNEPAAGSKGSQPARGRSGVWWGLIGLVVLLLAGGGVWHVLANMDPDETADEGPPPGDLAQAKPPQLKPAPAKPAVVENKEKTPDDKASTPLAEADKKPVSPPEPVAKTPDQGPIRLQDPAPPKEADPAPMPPPDRPRPPENPKPKKNKPIKINPGLMPFPKIGPGVFPLPKVKPGEMPKINPGPLPLPKIGPLPLPLPLLGVWDRVTPCGPPPRLTLERPLGTSSLC
jgi:hypothetical protein